MSERILVLGGGGHGIVVINSAQAAGYVVVGVLDDRTALFGEQLLGIPILGDTSMAVEVDASGGVVAIGDNAARAAVVRRIPLPWVTVVHPSAQVTEESTVGAGTVIFASATVQPRTTIGQHVIVNTGALVDHDCRIGDFVHVGPGATICGNVVIGAGAFIGAGATITPGVEIGSGAVVGAGAVVLGPVPADVTVVGVPARPLGEQ